MEKQEHNSNADHEIVRKEQENNKIEEEATNILKEYEQQKSRKKRKENFRIKESYNKRERNNNPNKT